MPFALQRIFVTLFWLVLVLGGLAHASQNGMWESQKFNAHFQWEKTHQTPPPPSVRRTR